MALAAEEVEGIDGLLIAILIWLPPIWVSRFRSVSKRWKNSIDDRFFKETYNANTRNRQLYYGGARILGLLQNRLCYSESCSHSHMKILPVARMNDVRFKKIPRKFGNFISSSNGLILCKVVGKISFHVVNLLTRTWVDVPYCELSSNSIGFACEENMHEFVPSFRIVGVGHLKAAYLKGNNTVQIQTYSSKTGKWAKSSLIGTGFFQVYEFRKPCVSNSVFHWPLDNSALAVYDPSKDENHLQLIELPQDEFNLTLTRSYNDDVLWVGTNDQKNMKFWKLPRDEHGGYKRTTTIARNEWILMHTIDTPSLWNDATLLLGNKKRKKRDGRTVDNKVRCFSFRAFTPWNPLSVILSDDSDDLRVFRYNLERKTIELIPYGGVPLLADKFLSYDTRPFPYFESLSLSSYALSGNTYG